LVLAIGFVSLFSCQPSPCSEGERQSLPDVIFVTLDTTRVDHIGAYGYFRDISPEIDRFASDAVLYRRAWSTAPWTLPAHASMFTGKHPTSHGAHFNARGGNTTLADALNDTPSREFKANRLGDDQVTLAELLQDAGYETAAFVGGPWLSPVFGLLQGYGFKDAEVSAFSGRRADELTDRAVAWIKEVPRDCPLHLLVNYFDPHWPFDPPPGYNDLPRAKAPLFVNRAAVNKGNALPPQQQAACIDRYDGEIRFMDYHFGRLMRTLRQAGRYDGAIIVVVADHGETLGEHGLIGHANWVYEEVLRVPLLVRFPGGRDSGTEVNAPVSVVDILPLLASEAGLELPKGVEGVPPGHRTLVLAESFRDAYAMKYLGPRFDRDLVVGIRWPWKLIVPDRGGPELYRLDRDPNEQNSRTGVPVEEELRKALKSAHAQLKPPEMLAPPEGVSPELTEKLRSLGYIE
jgi:arylsulfatase A-like enzyme